jgi:hypothetical protein
MVALARGRLMRATTAAALSLHDRGLWVIPAVGDDGKSPGGVVRGFQKWSRRPGRDSLADLFKKHTGCTIALLVGHCGLVVVDCDSDAALEVAEYRFGPSPILVRTPSGRGGHLYYEAPDHPVRQANLRLSDGLAIDIKAGKGAVVIVPPSVRPSTGVAYRFERGSWDDLSHLPVFRDMKRHTDAPNDSTERRNWTLFLRCLRLVRDCETVGELENKALIVNETDFAETLGVAEVEKIVGSAWKIQSEGRNMVGRGRQVVTPEARFELLADKPDALALDMRIRFHHERRRDRFAASPKAMAVAHVMPGWTAQRYRHARNVLVERGVWVVLKEGGKGPRDPYEYGFADRSPTPAKGHEIRPNTNKTPRPSVLPPGLRERKAA